MICFSLLTHEHLQCKWVDLFNYLSLCGSFLTGVGEVRKKEEIKNQKLDYVSFTITSIVPLVKKNCCCYPKLNLNLVVTVLHINFQIR